MIFRLNNLYSVCCKNIFTMKAPNSSSAPNYKLRGLVTLLYQYRVCSSKNSSRGSYQNHDLGAAFSKFGYVNEVSSSNSSIPRRLSMLSVNNLSCTMPADAATIHPIKDDVQPSIPAPAPTPPASAPAPAPPRPSSWYLLWGNWLLGTLLPVFLAFWNQKWNNLQKLKGEVEEIAEEVENVAEMVEKVASATEKVSEEVAEGLNDGRLKEAVLVIEHVSSVTAKDAQLTKDFVDKLADLKQDLKELETIAEPVINRVAQVEHGGEK